MALVLNKFNNSNKFYKSHVPFQIPVNTIAVNGLRNMVSINYTEPSVPVQINQTYGAENTFNFDLYIKNITTNILLLIEILHTEFFIISTNKQFNLLPSREQQITISANNEYLNNITNSANMQTRLTISVKNTGKELAYVPTNIISRPKIQLKSNISIE